MRVQEIYTSLYLPGNILNVGPFFLESEAAQVQIVSEVAKGQRL